jgi:hypothetical protein
MTRVVDWDQDGVLDVLWNRTFVGTQLLKGSLSGTSYSTVAQPSFQIPNPNSYSYNMFSVGDFNGDGKMDLIYSLGAVSVGGFSSFGISLNRCY